MTQKIIPSSDILAKKIRGRRKELGLTIEEAATRAGVGTKTWSRYEAGESIRADKAKGVCKALNWHNMPSEEHEDFAGINIKKYRAHEAWSKFLKSNFGDKAALSFAVGSDLVLDQIKEDLSELSSLPVKSHLGQLGFSLLIDSLPKQFLMYYDYDFLYRMQCSLMVLKGRAKYGLDMIAHSVIEELLIYLCNEEGAAFIELQGGIEGLNDDNWLDYQEWIFNLFGDEDIITFLYSDMYVDIGHSYHFSNWFNQQFYCNNNVDGSIDG